ncbi:MAG: hypothetical protein KTR30_18540 [Saprospiraceae bacterium]|nr:hypothetical protein [Saprospiraceae bacterium]
MSTELIIIIIGTGLLVLAILGSISTGDSDTGLIGTGLRIPFGLVGILLLIYGGYSYGAVNLQGQIEQAVVGKKLQVKFPVETVQVLSPIKADSVKCRILTLGVYPEANEKDIWVLLRPSDNRYYPQSDHTNTSYKRDGEWQVITRFGGDKGETYDVIVYETDETASEFFSSTISAWKEMESYPGLELASLPPTAVEVDRIAVALKENCRGVH